MQSDGSATLWRREILQGDVFERNLVSIVSLVWLLWETALMFPDEISCIWRGSMNRVKVLYLFGRYFALGTQLVNAWLILGPLMQLPVERQLCRDWFLFLTINSCLLLAALDIVVMLRVYVLYDCSGRVGIFLASLLVGQGALVSRCTAKTINVVPFSPTCDVLTTPKDVVYFTAGVMISQTILLIMTIAKRKVAFGQSPVVELVVRDGAWIYVLVIATFSVTVPYSLFIQVSKPHLVFVVPTTLLSVATCRLIINMQKVSTHSDSDRSVGSWGTNTNIAFTSYIDMSNDFSAPVSIHTNTNRSAPLDDASSVPPLPLTVEREPSRAVIEPKE